MHEHKTKPRNIQIFSCSRIIQFKSTHTRGLPLEGGWLGCYIYLWSINFNLIASSINRGWVEPLLTIKLIIYSSSHHSHALPLVMLALVTPPSIKSTLCSLSVSQSGLQLTQKPRRGRFIGMWVDPSSKEEKWANSNSVPVEPKTARWRRRRPLWLRIPMDNNIICWWSIGEELYRERVVSEVRGECFVLIWFSARTTDQPKRGKVVIANPWHNNCSIAVGIAQPACDCWLAIALQTHNQLEWIFGWSTCTSGRV